MSPEDIRNIRTSLELSQAQFASALGLKTQGAVSHLETGRKSPTGPVLLLLRNFQKKAEKKARRG